MDSIFKDMIQDNQVIVYMDNVLIFEIFTLPHLFLLEFPEFFFFFGVIITI